MSLTYHIRKTWEDADSQKGIDYNFLVNAKKACDKLDGYYVFDSNGNCVYPEISTEILIEEEKPMFKKGDAIQLIAGATQIDGSPLKDWTFKNKLYIKDMFDNNAVILAKNPRGSSIGVVSIDNIVLYDEKLIADNNDFDSYVVAVLNKEVPITNGPGEHYKKINSAKKYNLFTIINENNGWGKLKIGAGWINLNDVKKLSV